MLRSLDHLDPLMKNDKEISQHFPPSPVSVSMIYFVVYHACMRVNATSVSVYIYVCMFTMGNIS